MSLFITDKAVTTFAGSTVTDNRKTGLLIETLTDKQGAKLLMIKKIGDIGIEMSPYTTLNTLNVW